MQNINKNMLKHLTRAVNTFTKDPAENTIMEAEFVAIRTGPNEEDIAIIEAEHVMVFTDQLDAQKMVRMTLEKSNARYHAEADHQKFIEYLEENEPDVLERFNSQKSKTYRPFGY